MIKFKVRPPLKVGECDEDCEGYKRGVDKALS